MNFIYFAVTSAKIYADKLGAFKFYFDKEGGFTSAFILAVGIALGFALLYYIIARIVYSWPSITTWLITLVVCGGVAFWATGAQTGIHDKRGALPTALETCWKKKTANLTQEQQTPLQNERAKIQREFKQSYFTSSPVNRLCWTNAVIAIIFFYGFSILVNGLSKNGDNIPHPGVLTKKN